MTDAATKLVATQAEDEALWGRALTAIEAYLQRALRDLHAVVEQDAALTRERPADGAGEVSPLNQLRHFDGATEAARDEVVRQAKEWWRIRNDMTTSALYRQEQSADANARLDRAVEALDQIDALDAKEGT